MLAGLASCKTGPELGMECLEFIKESLHITNGSNDSPPPLMVTLTPFGYMAPRSKGMCTLQRYIEFLHSLPSAFPPTLTLYHIYIYRH